MSRAYSYRPIDGIPKEPPKQLLDMVDAFMTKGQSPDLLLGELRGWWSEETSRAGHCRANIDLFEKQIAT
jgi:hypothetical protein